MTIIKDADQWGNKKIIQPSLCSGYVKFSSDAFGGRPN